MSWGKIFKWSKRNKKDPNQNYQFLTNTFLTIVNKHAPLQNRIVRGNQAPFMIKEFQKANWKIKGTKILP